MAGLKQAVRLGGSSLTHSTHACAFFNSSEEEYRVMLPFAKEGFDAHDRLVHVVDKARRGERLERLQLAGVDVVTAARTGQLDVRPWEEAYLAPGRFDQNAMLALIEDTIKGGRRDGFRLTRLWANMEWALQDTAGVEDILEYETRLNFVLPEYDDVVVCTYDLNRFSAPFVVAMMRTHPQVIVGGFLQDNPFYVPPEKYLNELLATAGPPASPAARRA